MYNSYISTKVDAMASARIVTQLLRMDNIAYTLRPVSTFAHVEALCAALCDSDIKVVFMINCGAVMNNAT